MGRTSAFRFDTPGSETSLKVSSSSSESAPNSCCLRSSLTCSTYQHEMTGIVDS